MCSHSLGALDGSFLLKTHVLLDLQETLLVLLFQYLPLCFLYSYSEKKTLYFITSCSEPILPNHLSHFLFISFLSGQFYLLIIPKKSVFKVVFPTNSYLFPCLFPLFLNLSVYICSYVCTRAHMYKDTHAYVCMFT